MNQIPIFALLRKLEQEYSLTQKDILPFHITLAAIASAIPCEVLLNNEKASVLSIDPGVWAVSVVVDKIEWLKVNSSNLL